LSDIFARANELRENHRKALMELDRAFQSWKANAARLGDSSVTISAVVKENKRLRQVLKTAQTREHQAMIEWLEFAASHQRHLIEGGFNR